MTFHTDLGSYTPMQMAEGIASEQTTPARRSADDRQAPVMPVPALCCAVVVSYNPTPDLIENLRVLSPQLGRVLVVDNGSSPNCDSTLALVETIQHCILVRLDSNLGTAGALNIGVQRALRDAFAWILTFDQDSRVTPGYVESMLRDYAAADRNYDVGLVAPRYLDAKLGLSYESPRLPTTDLLEVVTAGAMTPAHVFRRVGIFDESLFIDHVDSEFSLRCRKHGYRLIASPSSLLIHSIGAMAPYRLWRRTYYPSNHSPGRRYYIARNRIHLILRNWRDWRWVVYEQRAATVELVKVLLMEKDRRAKLWCTACGVFDGLAGKLGKRWEL